MTRAYSELYLNDAKECMAELLDYTISDCGMDADWIASLFVTTEYSRQFESGNPAILSGMSGVELARAVIQKAYRDKELPSRKLTQQRSPAYWAGWVLAEYQWYSGRRFRDIFERVPLSEMLAMYPVYHEMDVSQFIEAVEMKYSQRQRDTRLKQIRENRGVSQAVLAELSGVHLRSIQLYEQRVNDIDKAQAATLYKLSRTLGCSIEDLLEAPQQ